MNVPCVNLFKEWTRVFLTSLCWVGQLVIVCGFLSGCSFEATLFSPSSVEQDHLDKLRRKGPDFQAGELVTTSSGYKFRAVVGEVSEKKDLPNGYKFEGVFYE